MKYKVILLDADDTIFDFQAGNRCAVEQLMDEIGYHAPNRFDHYQAINHACWEAIERGEMTQEELKVVRFQRFLSKYNIDRNPEEIAARFVDILGQQHMLIPHAEEAVRAIAEKLPVVILTNGITKVQKNRMSLSPIRELISGMVISQEVGFSKPRPEIFQHALNLMNVSAGEALVIGDSPTSDIKGANNAGIDACWYNPKGKNLPEGIHAEYTVSDIRDIVGVALREENA